MTDEKLTEEVIVDTENTEAQGEEEASLEAFDATPASETENESTDERTRFDIDSDIKELKEEFPELSHITSITELQNSIRYAALRDLGLSPGEAYLLTSRRRATYDNRSHLTASVPASAKSPSSAMNHREMEEMRRLFGDISDSEIHKLYKKVTKQ